MFRSGRRSRHLPPIAVMVPHKLRPPGTFYKPAATRRAEPGVLVCLQASSCGNAAADSHSKGKAQASAFLLPRVVIAAAGRSQFAPKYGARHSYSITLHPRAHRNWMASRIGTVSYRSQYLAWERTAAWWQGRGYRREGSSRTPHMWDR